MSFEVGFEVGLVLGVLIGLGAGGLFVWRSATAGAEEWVRDHVDYLDPSGGPRLGQQYATKGGPINRDLERRIIERGG